MTPTDRNTENEIGVLYTGPEVEGHRVTYADPDMVSMNDGGTRYVMWHPDGRWLEVQVMDGGTLLPAAREREDERTALVDVILAWHEELKP